MKLGLDSIDRARARARNAARLLAAVVLVVSLFAALSAHAAGAQTYDVTNLSLGGPTTLVQQRLDTSASPGIGKRSASC
jgi:hypothetical protein